MMLHSRYINYAAHKKAHDDFLNRLSRWKGEAKDIDYCKNW